ncbi:MAG: ATP-binding cassette domain-containing protein, partial [Planctomycetota bacterium]
MTDERAVEIRDLSFSYDETRVLEDVTLDVDAGRFVTIVGPNGGGKTTLLRLILGLLEPDRGTVRVMGRPPADARARMAHVPQHFQFDPQFPIRARNVVMMGCLGERGLWWTARKDCRRRAEKAMEQMRLQD